MCYHNVSTSEKTCEISTTYIASLYTHFICTVLSIVVQHAHMYAICAYMNCTGMSCVSGGFLTVPCMYQKQGLVNYPDCMCCWTQTISSLPHAFHTKHDLQLIWQVAYCRWSMFNLYVLCITMFSHIHIRWVLSFFEVYQEEREREQTLAWS